jgi:hypothetical protein
VKVASISLLLERKDVFQSNSPQRKRDADKEVMLHGQQERGQLWSGGESWPSNSPLGLATDANVPLQGTVFKSLDAQISQGVFAYNNV